MHTSLPSIYFLYPKEGFHPDMPMVADQYWYNDSPDLPFGMYASIVQTYLYLKEAGFPCELVTEMPKTGIVISHYRSIPFHFKPNPKLLVVCYKANYILHPYAQLHVVLNPQEPKHIMPCYYIPHWRQTGLIARDPERGDRFENIGYFGLPRNLAKELRSPDWADRVKELGLNWQVVPPEKWNDYREADAVVAVRDFKSYDFTHKPALKLYNAWHAHVPAILGVETAYRSERQSELDYIEVTSPEGILQALQRLRDDKDLRQAMIEHGKERAKATSSEVLTKQWQTFLEEVAVPAYERWCAYPGFVRAAYISRRFVALRWKGVQIRFQNAKTGLKKAIKKARKNRNTSPKSRPAS